MARVGVLALQGAFVEHVHAFEQLGAQAVEVRLPEQMRDLDGLVIPGGESTTMSLLIESYGLREPMLKLAERGAPIWGTCAGMIMLAKDVQDQRVQSLELMNLRVLRNAFGRQVDSFEAELSVPALGEEPFPAVFIRAPIVEEAGEGVEVLARLPDGRIVAARQGQFLATAFHPELTADHRFHQLLLRMAGQV
jgi:pyridoxal 5'-phosphate synthase pdxT subunit